MYEKQCKRCGCSMDPGEGRNGVCDDCMVRATDWTQMEMEEFISVKN